MVSNTQTFTYKFFNEGLNLRDDEIDLPIGETPRAHNIEIVRRTGLEKIKGFAYKFDEAYPIYMDLEEIFNFTDDEDEYRIIGVSYPDIYTINPSNGARFKIDSSLASTGDPIAFEANRQLVLVDGVNNPKIINKTTVTDITWPPSYTNNNNADGNLDQTSLAVDSNPATSDVGIPSFGVFHTNRVFLSGDSKAPRRIYASKVNDITNFSDNDPTAFNIAFFVDIPSTRPITGMEVISDKSLVIYCDREIYLMSGENPPGTNYPQPHYQITKLNSDVGALSHRLIAFKGNNDHYFVAGNGRVYQLSLTDNFQAVQPLGLTDKIFPLFESLSNEAIKRGRLLNNQIKGELMFWLPSTDQRRYPDQCLLLNYGDRPDKAVWSKMFDFNEQRTRGMLVHRETNEVLLATPNEILVTSTGNSYNGGEVKSIYQLTTLDFGAPENHKEVIDLTILGRSITGTTLKMTHVWDNGTSGVSNVTFAPFPSSDFGIADFGEDIFISSAGEPFQKVRFSFANCIGKSLKMTLQHDSATEDFTINSISLNYRTLGKE